MMTELVELRDTLALTAEEFDNNTDNSVTRDVKARATLASMGFLLSEIGNDEGATW